MSAPPGRPQPFRPFFLLAALDAVIGGGVWLPGLDPGPLAGEPAGVWHRNELLFGMMPAVLAGFVLTALPRWTRRPPPSSRVLALLVAGWLLGRAGHAAGAAWASLAAAAFILALAGLAGRQIAAARDRRNLKIVLLLASFAASAILVDRQHAALPAGFGLRLSLATLLGLVLVIAGRVVPALSAAWLETVGEADPIAPSPRTELCAAALAGIALAAWTLDPAGPATALVALGACAAQALRLGHWRGWRVRRAPAILALYLAYGWVPAGFALAAAHARFPERVGPGAAVHAWAMGAIGLMSLAVMASMVRRQNRIAFASSAALSAALACGLGAVAARLLAEAPGSDRAPLLALAALAWAAAFVLFLIAFRAELLWRRGRG